MSKDMMRGLIAGIILAVLIGWGILYIRTLSFRVSNIENFLNRSIQAQQQRQPNPEVKTK